MDLEERVDLGCQAGALPADQRGLPLVYMLVPANEFEYDPLLDLVEFGKAVIGDKDTRSQPTYGTEVARMPSRQDAARTRPKQPGEDASS